MAFRFARGGEPIVRNALDENGTLRVPYVQYSSVKIAAGQMNFCAELFGSGQPHVHLKLKPISVAGNQLQVFGAGARRDRDIGAGGDSFQKRESSRAARSIAGDFSLAAIGIKQARAKSV